MKFKIGEMSTMTRVSRAGIRFYEDIGLVHPERKSEGADRVYSERDIATLLDCRTLRDSGCSLPETLEILFADAEEKERLLMACCDRLQKEATLKERTELLMRQQVSALHKLNSQGVSITRETRPALYWTPLAFNVPLPSPEEGFRRPFADHSYLVEKLALLTNEGDLTFPEGLRAGACIERQFVEKIPAGPEVRFFPLVTCLHTVIEAKLSWVIPAESLVPLRQHITENRLQVTGPAVTKRAVAIGEKAYHDIWVPIR